MSLLTDRNLIFTNHAYARLKDRSLTSDGVYQTVNWPDFKKSQPDGQTKFIKTIAGRHYQVIAKYLADQQKWLIISNWVRGEEDREPLIWQMICAPFKIIWWVIKKIWEAIGKKRT